MHTAQPPQNAGASGGYSLPRPACMPLVQLAACCHGRRLWKQCYPAPLCSAVQLREQRRLQGMQVSQPCLPRRLLLWPAVRQQVAQTWPTSASRICSTVSCGFGEVERITAIANEVRTSTALMFMPHKHAPTAAGCAAARPWYKAAAGLLSLLLWACVLGTYVAIPDRPVLGRPLRVGQRPLPLLSGPAQ